MMEKTLGVLAGVGHLPVDVVRGAKQAGYRTVAIALVPETHEDLPKEADVFYAINIGKVGKIFSTLKNEGVSEVTMIGKVTKEILYKGGILIPDWQAVKLLMSLPDRHDDTIMNALVAKLEETGIHVMDQTLFLKHIMPEEGVLSRRKPTDKEWEDMKYGFRMAKKIGGLDIGQTVVVKDMAIMAVEAIEGTDACIKRGGSLGRRAGGLVAEQERGTQEAGDDRSGGRSSYAGISEVLCGRSDGADRCAVFAYREDHRRQKI
jgi:DUF1009 family protein